MSSGVKRPAPHEKGREIQETSSFVPLKREPIDIHGDAIEFKPETLTEEVKFEFKSESVSDYA